MSGIPSAQEVSPKEKAPDFETLRGANGALKLAGIIENSTKYSGNERADNGFSKSTVIDSAISGLQKRVSTTDTEIRKAGVLNSPQDQNSLRLMVDSLIRQGKVSDKLDLMELFMYNGKNRLARQDQWGLVEALYGVDTSVLVSGHAGGRALPGTHRLEDVHSYIAQLIQTASLKKGKEASVVVAEQPEASERSVLTAPTLIDGVTATITMDNRGFSNAWGYPHITGATLSLDPAFLGSLRPLSPEEFKKYWPRSETSQNRGSGETGRGEDRTRNSTGSGFGESQSSYGAGRERSKRGADFDPRDPSGYYRTLGINPDTDPDDIEEVLLAAYRRLARKYHADTGGETGDHEKMKRINEAYEFLQKDSNRGQYGK
ncbi:J domain-containing protein [Candidatus Daviesbacteria bacterium]|nr:J domain-containing protein [Candidatus Daviesbacteria bacterium]